MPRILFIFLDGVGLGPADPRVNAFTVARLPTLSRLLDGRSITVETAPYHAPSASLVGLDASLGVPGLPQSGTGQAALLTGRNAPKLFGRHYGPWTPTALRPLVAEESVLANAKRMGSRVAFANAYPEEAVRPLDGARSRSAQRSPLRAGPPLAALGSGLLTRHTRALARGDAVASEITNDGWREHLGRLDVPVISPENAGHNLARIAAAHDLTLFAHYTTDTAGHRRDLDEAVAALERVDAFLGGVLSGLPDDVLVIVASDHGNIEDTRAAHTTNPALALVYGPGHEQVARRLKTLMDVAPVILGELR